MRFFLDTNILFDLFVADRPSHKDSQLLVAHGIAGNAEVLLSPVSVMTVLYSMKKFGVLEHQIVARFNLLLPHFQIAFTGKTELLAGINSGWNDLEDTIQFHSALGAGRIDAIVSNDRDFKQQDRIPVITPAQAVKRLK